jgi:hypothetical protein
VKKTSTFTAPDTTWLFVMITPPSSMMTPDPCPRVLPLESGLDWKPWTRTFTSDGSTRSIMSAVSDRGGGASSTWNEARGSGLSSSSAERALKETHDARSRATRTNKKTFLRMVRG